MRNIFLLDYTKILIKRKSKIFLKINEFVLISLLCFSMFSACEYALWFMSRPINYYRWSFGSEIKKNKEISKIFVNKILHKIVLVKLSRTKTQHILNWISYKWYTVMQSDRYSSITETFHEPTTVNHTFRQVLN